MSHIPTVREMVREWGDGWRLMMPSDSGHKITRADTLTHDGQDAAQMYYMETGLFPRIKSADLMSDGDQEAQ